MVLYKTVDSDICLRIESDEEAAITVHKDREYGHIISLVVPEESRGLGVGKQLLLAAEQELMECGIRRLDMDYMAADLGLSAFCKAAGFSEREGTRVLSVPLRELFSSKMVKQAIRLKPPGTDFIPLSSLAYEQWDALIDRLKRTRIRISNRDLVRLNQDVSGVILDGDRFKAVIFCSENRSDLHVDLLLGFGSQPQKYVISVILGMLGQIGQDRYENLTAIAVNRSVPALFEKVLSDKKQPQAVGRIVYAFKQLKEHDEEIPVTPVLDPDRDEIWRKEIRKLPLQANINYKMVWSRVTSRPEADGGRLMKSTPARSIRYDKDEDTRKGLTYPDTMRITADNLDDFRDYLPPDEARDIPRPFHRGLAVVRGCGEKPSAVMVWRYESYEQKSDTGARILYFHADTAEAGATLLAEYTGEIAGEDTQTSSFVVTDIPAEDERILSDAGFAIERREDVDLILTGADFEAVPLLKNKTTHFVKSLREVTNRLFQRGVARLLFLEREGTVEDLAYLSGEWFDKELSACIVVEYEVSGMLLLHRLSDGTFFIDLVQSVGGDPEIEILYLLRFSMQKLIAKYGNSVKVILRRDNETSRQIASRFFPSKSGQLAVFGKREEG